MARSRSAPGGDALKACHRRHAQSCADDDPGPRGLQGATGAQGAPGSALGYAHINPDGSIDTARSKNINRAVVFADQYTGDPEYCINATVTPHNVIAEATYPEHLGVAFGTSECTHNGVTYNIDAVVDASMDAGSNGPYRTDFYLSIN